MLLILTGWTKVTASAATGYQALLALRGPGDIVGESAAVTGRPRSATVTALERVPAGHSWAQLLGRPGLRTPARPGPGDGARGGRVRSPAAPAVPAPRPPHPPPPPPAPPGPPGLGTPQGGHPLG
ncbi:cyclic nucleotide-binding domain-containing protein [Streptomyces sp. NPDC090077]|uniref:cyclic nucleotide-binding domain-containing protein n=1 Tax=Streptomyces sp. NPDC090077 TaxID=3365938 RepID=UPI0038299AD5